MQILTTEAAAGKRRRFRLITIDQSTMKSPTIFSVFLDALGVPMTQAFSDRRFRSMPFQSLFGFSRLLKEYGIDSDGLMFVDKSRICNLPLPSLVQEKGKFVVLTGISQENAEYSDSSGRRTRLLKDFSEDWSGVALAAYPTAQRAEPDYKKHRLMDLIASAKTCILWLCTAFLIIYAYLSNGMYTSWWKSLWLLLDIAGLYVSWQLVLKSVNIHTKAADKICGAIQKGGCDTVLEQKASTFFGIFGWSEVGLAYFGVSLAALLIFPACEGWLAAINVCCLPFSFWSVWYQKYRAKAWCTMCLTVQCLLWLIFFTGLAGGAFRMITPSPWPPVILISAYAATLMGINRLATTYKNKH